MVGLRPSFFGPRTLARTWGTRAEPLGPRQLEGEACGIPHLAKNERDVGHPAMAEGIEPESPLTEGTAQDKGRLRGLTRLRMKATVLSSVVPGPNTSATPNAFKAAMS